MAIDYTSIAEGALQALADAGQAMTLTVPGASTYDPATATTTAESTPYVCTGVLLPPSAMKGSGFTFVPDVLVRAQALAYIAAAGLAATPAPGCTLTIGATVWQIIGSDTLAPAGVAVLHAVALVRS
jgi:hypothetical protein